MISPGQTRCACVTCQWRGRLLDLRSVRRIDGMSLTFCPVCAGRDLHLYDMTAEQIADQERVMHPVTAYVEQHHVH